MKTKSEQFFESFLEENGLPFEKIKEDTTPRPDYLVLIADKKLVFEIKELAEDDKFGLIKRPGFLLEKSHSRIVGDHVRHRIQGSKKQIQFGLRHGIPSVLLIYNNLDPLQMFGTEDGDFTTAMYGELTTLINKQTSEASELFHGRNQLLQEQKNTSFSALGRLREGAEGITLTLFENVFAAVRIRWELLPRCFDARRIKI